MEGGSIEVHRIGGERHITRLAKVKSKRRAHALLFDFSIKGKN